MIFWAFGWLPETNLATSLIFAGILGFFSLLLLCLWVPGFDGSRLAHERVEDGIQMGVLALVFLLFGLVAFAVAVAAGAVFLAWVVCRAASIMVEK